MLRNNGRVNTTDQQGVRKCVQAGRGNLCSSVSVQFSIKGMTLNALKSTAPKTHSGSALTWKRFRPRNTCHYQCFLRGVWWGRQQSWTQWIPWKFILLWAHANPSFEEKQRKNAISKGQRWIISYQMANSWVQFLNFDMFKGTALDGNGCQETFL